LNRERLFSARWYIFFALAIVFLFIGVKSEAQTSATIYGKITDERNQPLELVNIAVLGSPGGVTSAKNGSYELRVTARKPLTIVFSFVGYESDTLKATLNPDERLKCDKSLKQTATELPSVVVEDKALRNTGLSRIDPRAATIIPSASAGIESLIKTMPGVVSNNELSSQYSVRGGNYDENLVYVNDIEIYRPFLVRSGQQEGLSFLNSDLVSSVLFSAGGFDARYGDKMSSVLDIRYKKPHEFAGSASASLLGGAIHLEGTSKNQRFTYLAGVRYKSNQYLLNSLETKGDYKPRYFDLQSLLTYNVSKKVEISVLGYAANNVYTLIPESRETNFGTLDNPLRLKIYFDGRESDSYSSLMGAATVNYKPSDKLNIKWIVSGYNSKENESYDILGQYWIQLLENKPDSIEVVENKGVGSYLTHARNKLNIDVFNIENRYSFISGNSYTQWGIKYQHEIISDRINEWMLVDSAGFSIPYSPGVPGMPGNLNDLAVYYNLKTSADITSNRYTGFLQNNWNLDGDSTRLTLTTGIRFQYWDYNDQFLVSPRATISYKPNWQRDILFRFSTGYYFQPPFYRELRNFGGQINPEIRAQKSIHFVLGSDLNFMAWERPFKFVTEVYYKMLRDLIPYEVDNVRIRYLGYNDSDGYAAGIDMKVNGEFVKGVESWASLSIMQTEEDLYDDSYYAYYNQSGERIIAGVTTDQVVADSVLVDPGFIPRPTDQRVTFGLFFQDYLPMNPTYKMNLGLYFGTGLTTGAPNTPLYKHVFRMPAYRRVDIGFAKQVIGGDAGSSSKTFFRSLKSLWITAEILNLLQISNTISYMWVRDFDGNQYGVPNYLTSRQINLKVSVEF
jgi:hypothetical protein